jgi:hypothetical protein
MIDLNRSRRRREIEIADEIVAELVKHTSPPLELVTQVFVSICERRGIVIDEASGRRILNYTAKEIDRQQRIVDRLADAMEARA